MRDMRINKIVKILIIAILLPVGVLVPYFGVESQYGAPITAEAQSDSLKQRVQNYKKQLDREVKKAEQDRFILRCAVAKENITILSDRLAVIQKKRVRAYADMSSRLQKVYERLEEQAFETSKLKANLDELNAKIASFNAELKSLKRTVDDMKQIDCKNDPVAFIAALSYARDSHRDIISIVDDIREYLTNTIKPTMAQIREQVEAGQTVGGEN
jgi:glutamyl/glutaminyl-tRNA synthetase